MCAASVPANINHGPEAPRKKSQTSVAASRDCPKRIMFAFSTATMLIADLDRYEGGLLEVNQAALRDAARAMQSSR